MEQTQEKLDKILRNCDTCKAKMCQFCSNSKMKKALKLKLKELGDCGSSSGSKEVSIVEKIKELFK